MVAPFIPTLYFYKVPTTFIAINEFTFKSFTPIRRSLYSFQHYQLDKDFP